MKRSRPFAAVTLAILLAGSPAASLDIVYDPTAVARLMDQIRTMERQLSTLTEQLAEARRLYGSFNRLTDAADIAGLLNSKEFRQYLPSGFSDMEGLIRGLDEGPLSSSSQSYLDQNRYYSTPGDSFYAQELGRIARQTGSTHAIGQAVYETASRRINELDKLRQRIAQAKDVKEILDLSARIQAESSFLQNDVLRMQGLAMIQSARSDMDAQRERERGRQLVDQMWSALK